MKIPILTDDEDDDENDDSDNEDDSDNDEDEDDSDNEDDSDDDENDDSESPIHKNIAHIGGSDKESVNRITDGEDSSVEVYETSISDALFPDENYYVTNELDGDIYKIGHKWKCGY